MTIFTNPGVICPWNGHSLLSEFCEVTGPELAPLHRSHGCLGCWPLTFRATGGLDLWHELDWPPPGFGALSKLLKTKLVHNVDITADHMTMNI